MMSKEFKNIDDLFQSAFSNESAEVPAFVKEKIDKKIGLGKPNKGWTLLGGIALLTFLTAITLLILNQTGTSGGSTLSAENKTNPAAAETHSPTNTNSFTPANTNKQNPAGSEVYSRS